MKIAYIAIKGIGISGGIEKYTLELASRLVKRGHEALVYSTRNYGTMSNNYKGIQIKTLPSLKSRNFEKLSITLLASIDQFLEKDIDIVHYHAFGQSIFSFIPRIGNFIPKIKKRKIVLQGHGLEWMRSKWGIIGKLFFKITEKPSLKFVDMITVVSKVQKNYLERNYGIDVVYIPPGIDIPLYRTPRLIKEYGLQGNDYILFTSRLVPEKGAHYLIDAYRKLDIDKKLVLVGDVKHEDKYKLYLKYLAEETNGKVIFTGYVPEEVLQEFYSNAYIFVLPSEIEGLSAALLEAMSYENCCLVSDIPENLEALNGYGFTFKNKNIDSLANSLKYLLDNQKEVIRVKQEAKDYVLETYSWGKVVSQIEYLYKNLLGREA